MRSKRTHAIQKEIMGEKEKAITSFEKGLGEKFLLLAMEG
jgi:hypothetical protein